MKSSIKRILLVDDDEDELVMFELALQKAGLEVEVQLLQSCPENDGKDIPVPDLIFLDINMPRYDGFAWLQGIREKVSTPIPVIMYSTTRSKEKVEYAYRMGANLFLTKPDNAETLSRFLRYVFQLDWTKPRELTEQCYQLQKFHLAS